MAGQRTTTALAAAEGTPIGPQTRPLPSRHSSHTCGGHTFPLTSPQNSHTHINHTHGTLLSVQRLRREVVRAAAGAPHQDRISSTTPAVVAATCSTPCLRFVAVDLESRLMRIHYNIAAANVTRGRLVLHSGCTRQWLHSGAQWSVAPMRHMRHYSPYV